MEILDAEIKCACAACERYALSHPHNGRCLWCAQNCTRPTTYADGSLWTVPMSVDDCARVHAGIAPRDVSPAEFPEMRAAIAAARKIAIRIYGKRRVAAWERDLGLAHSALELGRGAVRAINRLTRR